METKTANELGDHAMFAAQSGDAAHFAQRELYWLSRAASYSEKHYPNCQALDFHERIVARRTHLKNSVTSPMLSRSRIAERNIRDPRVLHKTAPLVAATEGVLATTSRCETETNIPN